MSNNNPEDYQRRIAKRLAESDLSVTPYRPSRPRREEWSCPNCGLNGDHMKVPISEQKCKGCCATDAANDLLDAARAFLGVDECYHGAHVEPREGRDDAAHACEEITRLRGLREAIAKAEGRR